VTPVTQRVSHPRRRSPTSLRPPQRGNGTPEVSTADPRAGQLRWSPAHLRRHGAGFIWGIMPLRVSGLKHRFYGGKLTKKSTKQKNLSVLPLKFEALHPAGVSPQLISLNLTSRILTPPDSFFPCMLFAAFTLTRFFLNILVSHCLLQLKLSANPVPTKSLKMKILTSLSLLG